MALVHQSWNLEMLVFVKTGEPREKPWKQGQEPTANLNHTHV